MNSSTSYKPFELESTCESPAISSTSSTAPQLATATTSVRAEPKGTKKQRNNKKEQLTIEKKKILRKEKNRISARACRKRKREAAQELEREINLLESENLKLRLQLQIGDEGEETTLKQQNQLTESLADLLSKQNVQEAEIHDKIEELKEKFIDYGRTRRSAIEFHLKNVERLLMPTTTTSIAMCALKGEAMPHSLLKNEGDDAEDISKERVTNEETLNEVTDVDSSSSKVESPDLIPSSSSSSSIATSQEELNPKALFHYFVKYLNVTPDQASALKDSRYVAKELDDTLAQSLAMLHELRTCVRHCAQDLETQFDSVQSILSPTQAAKFLVWVSNNQACMHMLNELWNKMYDTTTATKEAKDDAEENKRS